MKITDIRMMRLRGPLAHSMGGHAGLVTKVVVRVDTDAGLYGLGEADDFLGRGGRKQDNDNKADKKELHESTNGWLW